MESNAKNALMEAFEAVFRLKYTKRNYDARVSPGIDAAAEFYSKYCLTTHIASASDTLVYLHWLACYPSFERMADFGKGWKDRNKASDKIKRFTTYFASIMEEVLRILRVLGMHASLFECRSGTFSLDCLRRTQLHIYEPADARFRSVGMTVFVPQSKVTRIITFMASQSLSTR